MMKSESNDTKKKTQSGNAFPTGIALGMLLGVAIGAAIDNLALGIAIGMLLGIAVGVVWKRQAKGDDDE